MEWAEGDGGRKAGGRIAGMISAAGCGGAALGDGAGQAEVRGRERCSRCKRMRRAVGRSARKMGRGGCLWPIDLQVELKRSGHQSAADGTGYAEQACTQHHHRGRLGYRRSSRDGDRIAGYYYSLDICIAAESECSN